MLESLLLSLPLAQNSEGPGLDSPSEEVSDSTKNLIESVLETIPRAGIAILIIIAGWLLAKLVRRFLKSFLERDHTPSFARVMSKIAGALLISVAIFIGVTVTFPSVKPVDLLAGLGFLSVAIGFAFQDILENTLAGVLLLFRQPFQSGDQIEVLEKTGTVQAITIRETQIKTFDGKLVVVPNRDVYKNVIVVQTHYERRRLAFIVGVAYEDDAGAASGVIVDALKGIDGIDEDPAPEALINELGVSTVNIEARFWTDPQQHEARIMLHKAIKTVKKAIDDAGYEMPADIVALQATPSFKAAVQNQGELTPAGSVKQD